MKKIVLFLGVMCFFTALHAQLLTWSPQFPNDNSTIVITMDASKGNRALNNFAGPVYMHLGVITNLSTTPASWRYVPTTWGTTTAPQATAVPGQPNKWTFTLTNPRAYFNAAAGGVPANETILRVALLFRNATGTLVQKNTDNSDMYIPIYPAGTNSIIFTTPALEPLYNISNENITASVGQSVSVTATASSSAGTLRLFFNGNLITGPLTGTNTISGSAQVTTAGTQQFIAEMNLNGTFFRDTVQFYVPLANIVAALPAGVEEGINYWPGCDSVTLVLYAPGKQYVVVLGDFEPNNWLPQSKYQMNKTPDNLYYWITIKNLTPGVEYSYQYLVDNSIYIADPYSELVLDPWNDPFIPTSTYPNLKPYPSDPNVSSGKNAYVTVFKTCAPQYNWKVTDFQKPDKRNLVIYELLVRDFGDARNYQMIIDSMDYFKRLGVNAIQFMPVNEFAGNESWGYNPVFYCALDKAYGTKDKFKELIDLCHQNGMAVILDVVYNQLDAFYAPQGRLYWNSSQNRPAANNPWLNQVAPHPYSVFEDLNHTSPATQYLVRRAMEYWIKEYKVDGYRIDLAKGFTQKQTNETTVEDFDGARVANLNRYYDYIVPKYPGTYMILEFLGTQRTEEQVYASKGYLLWSECHDPYKQAVQGFNTNSDFSKVMYNSSQTAFSVPAAVGYMESHDKERIPFEAIAYGNSLGGYNTRDTSTALRQTAAAASVLLTTPGPKMIWQFGERGYDVSIFFNGGRTANKPHLWEQWTEPRRKALFEVFSKLNHLRISNPSLFNSTNFSYDFFDNNGLFKRYQITDNNSNGIKLNVVANLDVAAQTRNIGFQATGNWLNYVSNGTGSGLNGPTNSTFNLGSNNNNVTLQPGEFHVYLYHPPNVYIFNGDGNWSNAANWTYGNVPPANLPSGAEIIINPRMNGECVLNINQVISQGAKITIAEGRKLRIPLNLSIQ